jgi:hypothetical protein
MLELILHDVEKSGQPGEVSGQEKRKESILVVRRYPG